MSEPDTPADRRPTPPAPQPREAPPAPRPVEDREEGREAQAPAPARETGRAGTDPRVPPPAPRPREDDAGAPRGEELPPDEEAPRSEDEPRPAAAPAADKPDLSSIDEARKRREETAQEGERHRYWKIVQDIRGYVERGYELIGLVGYAHTGKTHSLKALDELIGFEPEVSERLRRERSPAQTQLSTFPHPYSGPWGKYVFVDAGGDLYGLLRDNDWTLKQESVGLFHALLHCGGVLMLLNLNEGHFNLGDRGFSAGMSEAAREREGQMQDAQREVDFFRLFLLFLRALRFEGDAERLAARCAGAASAEEALTGYTKQARRLDVPVTVLFTQADRRVDGQLAVAPGRYLSPGRGTVGTAAFVARHLPRLYDAVAAHARRFKFDFAQSYVEVPEVGADGGVHEVPRWKSADGDEPLSVGLLPGVELVLRHHPPAGAVGRFLRRFEMETRTALRLHRRLHPKLWQGVEDGRP